MGPVSPDADALRALNRAAFPEEDLTALVAALAVDPSVRHIGDGTPAAHATLSPCTVGAARVWLLGPVAVHPDRQGEGKGRQLIEAALEAVASDPVCVLGDPAFYGRFGFTPEAQIAPPYPIPPDWAPAWQSVRAGALAGRLEVPQVWSDPALWS